MASVLCFKQKFIAAIEPSAAEKCASYLTICRTGDTSIRMLAVGAYCDTALASQQRHFNL